MLSEMMSKTFETCNSTVSTEKITEQLEETAKMKAQVKDKFMQVLTRENFMRNLLLPISEWPALTVQADEELEKAKVHLREAEKTADSEKKALQELISVVVQGSRLYQRQVDSLKENLQALEELIEEHHSVQKTLSLSDPGDALANKQLQEKCSELENQLRQGRKELLLRQHENRQLEVELARLQLLNAPLDVDEEKQDAECLNRMQKIITDFEELGNLSCEVMNPSTIVLQFPSQPSHQPGTSGRDNQESDLILKVTMSLSQDALGNFRVSNLESNITSFNLEDLWEEYKDSSTCSLPQLVSRIKARWLSHLPLLAEINCLQSRFAIDWIQKDNMLRVIVGKGAEIVCSLDIPPTYPHQGQVTLSSILGVAETVRAENLQPHTGSRLEDWVQYLEETFGKP